MLSPFTRLASALLCLGALFFPGPSPALPQATNAPGGIALVRLAAVSEQAAAPHAWLGDQPVWVTAENGQWLAVVGLALDLASGRHELTVDDGARRTLDFTVETKTYPAQHIKLKDSSKVTLSAADEARAVREIAAIQTLKRYWRAADDTDSNFSLPATGRLASRFGLRRFFNGEARAPHSGLDLAVPRGTPIRTSAPGRVLATDEYFFNGQTVFIDHGNGLISMYCHLEGIDVQPGERVGAGDILGRSGMSGRASGPHLHWSVILNGVMVDPQLFLRPQKKN